MPQTVTAILVVRSGSTHVQRTLDSLSAQTRRPDSVVVIETSSDGSVNQAVSAFGPDQYLATKERLTFPAAVAAAVRSLEEPAGDDRWLWLLAQDTAPEPEALERLMAIVEVSPSVAVAGPKVVAWDDRSRIVSYGQSITGLGATVALVEDELDQGQHDVISDVLGVTEAAMLVRHSVYAAVGGLDQGLPVVDGGLDLCVRARLAGHRVVVAPDARVALAGDGVVSPRLSPRTGAPRVSTRVRRAAQLHRRLAFAPTGALVWHWLALVPLAVLRSLGWLLGKRPGAIGGELAAAFQTAFAPGHLSEARRNVAASRTVGWAAIAPLRVPAAEVRRRRMLAREAALTLLHGETRELDFFGTGGGWVVLGALVASVAINARLFGAQTIGGGGLLPLDGSVSELWSGLGWGWRDVGIGFSGPSDPFTAVLGILGTLTFWQPSFSLVLLWFAAMPIAALGAWLVAAKLTTRGGLRAVFALAWAFAPPLLASLSAGRPSAVLAHVLLPWLVFAALAARTSWAASGATALLAAGLAACAPSLTPALAIAWVVWTATSGRAVFRAFFVPLPTLALFLPLALTQLGNGHPLRIFADPGVPVPSAVPSTWQLLAGFPGDSGWSGLGDALGWSGGAASTLVAVLVAPIAVLALSALFLRPSLRTAGALFGALLGLISAAVSAHTVLQAAGSDAVRLWTGPALSLYWFGATAAAVLALAVLGTRSVGPAWITAVATVLAVVPAALVAPLGAGAVTAGTSGRLPAYVMAESSAQPRTATLVLSPEGSDRLTAGLVHGIGETLNDQSTVASTRTALSTGDEGIDRLAVNLASRSGYDASGDLTRYGISFVYVETGRSPSADVARLAGRASVALDADPLFTRVGTTTTGMLWSTAKDVKAVQLPAHPGGWRQPLILLMLAVVFGVFLLLSIPTGRAGSAARAAAPRMPRRPLPGTDPSPAGGQDAPEIESIPDAEPEPAPEDKLVPVYVGAGGSDEQDAEN